MQINSLYIRHKDLNQEIEEFRSKEVTVFFPFRSIGYHWLLTKKEDGTYKIICNCPEHFNRFATTLAQVAEFDPDTLKYLKVLDGVEDKFLDTFNAYLAQLHFAELNRLGEIDEAKERIENIIKGTRKIEFMVDDILVLVALNESENLTNERLNKLVQHLTNEIKNDVEDNSKVRIYHVDARTNDEIYKEEEEQLKAWDGSYTYFDDKKVERRKRTKEEADTEKKERLESVRENLPGWDWE